MNGRDSYYQYHSISVVLRTTTENWILQKRQGRRVYGKKIPWNLVQCRGPPELANKRIIGLELAAVEEFKELQWHLLHLELDEKKEKEKSAVPFGSSKLSHSK
ncbi:hypothetical protein MRB53_033142 [Persea americana]|uniref:Uncharacterized protein n=1 Tax=Persea americana TaxID=3435 RepID=A0ACC2KTU0_PERAE|nr:hypothetical protein MRB53_033142 [Persea americana]